MENLYNINEYPISAEISELIVSNPNVRIERIISPAHFVSDWFDQDENEYVILLQGQAVLEYEDGVKVELTAGNSLIIAAHQKHRLVDTSEEPLCIWMCVHY